MEDRDKKHESENESAAPVDLSEPADDDKFEGEDAEVLKLIHTRFEAHEFPAVQPQEGAVEDVSSAKVLVELVRQFQQIRIQSYVEENLLNIEISYQRLLNPLG